MARIPLWHENIDENHTMGFELIFCFYDIGGGGHTFHTRICHTIDGDTLLPKRQSYHASPLDTLG